MSLAFLFFGERCERSGKGCMKGAAQGCRNVVCITLERESAVMILMEKLLRGWMVPPVK